MTTCSNCGAGRPTPRKGLCERCYLFLRRHGRRRPPVAQHLCKKLSPEEVDEIRSLYVGGGVPPTYKQLGEKYGVFLTTIGRVVRGETWRHSTRAETTNERS